MFKEIDRRQYSAKPFWAWNGKLEKEELLRQIDIMQQMGFGGFFMHSRTGLQTEYLGQEWFDLINACADRAKEKNMESWLYDEDRWPSGSAGGIATKEEKYRMQYIRLNLAMKEAFEWSDDIISAFAADVDGVYVTNCMQISEHTDISALDAKHVLFFTHERMIPTDTYNGSAYLDTMSKQATLHYLQSTHEKYKQHCANRLSDSIQGIFTDEPHRGALMCGFAVPNHDPQYLCPYTDDLFEEFEKAYGYPLQTRLPELFLQKDGNRYSPVKWQYTELLTRLFLKNFAEPYQRWCTDNHMLLTGHVLHEDSLTCQTATNGSVMRYYEHMDYPGVDVLTEQNTNYCIVKQLTSVARQTGKKWLLSELDGCTGWQMTFQNYKAIGDWQAIMGINLRCPHLSWYTMQAEAKRDYPASILHQSAWYPAYAALEDYYARIGQITTNSNRLCKTAVIMPVESIWVQIYAGWAKDMQALDETIAQVDKKFADTYLHLLAAHVDFDYADEEMLSRLYRIQDGRLWIGKADYQRVIVSGMSTIRSSTLKILQDFKNAGGEVLFADEPPFLVDAEESDAACEFAKTCTTLSIEQLKTLNDQVQIQSEKIILQTYQDENHKYYFMLNTDRTHRVESVDIDFGEDVCIQEWDPETGNAESLQTENNHLCVTFEAGQLRLFVDCSENLEIVPEHQSQQIIQTVKADPDTQIQFDEPNVLVLDYASWQIDDGAIEPQTEVLIADSKIRQIFGLPERGGEMLQPWFIAQQTPQKKGQVTLYYSFEAEDLVESPIYLMYEEPENFAVSINGIPLNQKPEPGIFIDKCFTRVQISDYVQTGVNTICLQTDFTNRSNIEAIYLLGNFGVSMPDKKITAPQQDFRFESLTEQGYPFYGGKLTYALQFHTQLQPNQRAVLKLRAAENVACYEVNGVVKGFEPMEYDVTEQIQNKQPVFLTVYLTRRNMFGPLHGVPKIMEAVGPMHFLGGMDTDYVLYEAGLTEVPEIEIRTQNGGEKNV